MKKNPRFFCQNCGTEVQRNAEFCAGCGRIFVSVCCPACGHAGSQELFEKGCPLCGYCSGGEPAPVKKSTDFKRKKKSYEYSPDPLPLWLYAFIVILCASAAAALFAYL